MNSDELLEVRPIGRASPSPIRSFLWCGSSHEGSNPTTFRISKSQYRIRSRSSRLASAFGGLALVVACCVASPKARSEDLRSKFDQIAVGLTKEAVLSLMGIPPTSTQEISTLGVSKMKLRWDEGAPGATYQVEFVFGRSFSKRVCNRRDQC